MDNLNLTVNFVDGSTKNVEVIAADIVAFELKFEKSIDDISLMTHFYYLGWNALKRVKETEKPFEEWISEVRGVVPADPKDS